MIARKIQKELERFLHTTHQKALLITGARQVGKTYSIREFASSHYENVVAQELKAHGFELYYFNNKKQGEIDFLIEKQGTVLPIEIKSGKDYTKHAALSNVMSNSTYEIPKAFVFQNGNVSTNGNITYYPIYMSMFVEVEKLQEKMIYKLDLDILK